MRAVFFFLAFSTAILANPKGHTSIHGQANLLEKGDLLEITTSDQAILHWESFSIAPNETTRFIQPSIDSAVLNRVTGTEISNLLGQLQSNGRVYLTNPNGIFIGKEGCINTAAFIATTLDIKDAEFLNEHSLSFESDSLGSICNLGTIETSSGPIALIAHRIENSALLKAQSVFLVAGHHVLFDPTGDSLLYIHPDLKSEGIENQGTIEAVKTVLQSDSAPTSLAIGLGGLIDANTVANIDGEIYLIAKDGDICISETARLKASEMVVHAEQGLVDLQGEITSDAGTVHLLGKKVYLQGNASIDVSGDFHGGTLLVGGDYQGLNSNIPNAEYIFVSTDAIVNCSARIQGDGGKAIFWGDKGISFHAKVQAEGGKEGGDGGLVEVSSPGQFAFSGLVSTSAPKGQAGTLLLDPTTITVSSAATSGGSFAGGTFSGAGPTANLNNTDLSNQLALGNVVINASVGAGGTGSVTFNSGAPVSWSANQLGISVTNDINFNGELNISGSGSMNIFPPGNLNVGSTAVITYSSTSPFFSFGAMGAVTVNGGQITCNSDAAFQFSATTGNLIIENGATLINNGNGNTSISAGGTQLFIITNSSVAINGSGTLLIDASSAGGEVNFSSCSVSNNSSLTINANLATNLSGTVTLNSPSVTLTASAGKALIRGSSAILNSSATSISFPNGVDSSPLTSGKDLTINASNASLSFGGNSDLSALSVNASNITVEDISLSVFSGDLSMTAGNNITLNSNPQISGSGNVTLIAGNNFTGSGSGLIETQAANDLTLVIDNSNPNPPNIGSSSINIPNYTLQTDSGSGVAGNGKVLIYSTSPSLTTLPSTINTATFTKGSFSGSTYNPGPNEYLGFWYLTQPPPDPPLFQVIYKMSSVSATTLQTIQVAVTEPVANPTQIAQVTGGLLVTPSTPSPTTSCKTPSVSVQAQ